MHIPWKLLRKEWNKKLSTKNSCTYYEYEIKTLSSSQAPGDNAEISGPCWSRRVLPPRGVWKSNRGNPTHPWDENSVWPNVRSGSSPVDIDQTLAKLQLRASLDKRKFTNLTSWRWIERKLVSNQHLSFKRCHHEKIALNLLVFITLIYAKDILVSNTNTLREESCIFVHMFCEKISISFFPLSFSECGHYDERNWGPVPRQHLL